MNDNKLMNIIYLALILPVILFIVLFLLFFFSVNKVYAASSIMGYNSGGADLTSCYDCYELNTNKNYYDFNYDYSYQNSTNVNLQFNNILTFRVGNNGSVNIGAPSIIVANGYLTYDISSYCTEVVGTKTTTEKLNYTEIVINYAYTCDIPNYSGNFPNYRSLKVTYTRSLVSAPIFTYSRAYDNGFTIQESPYQQDVSGDINAVGGNIINNQNQNTQSIINNNNSNTQSIIDNQNQNTQQVTDAIEKQNLKCETYNYNNEPKKIQNSALGANGQIISNNNYDISDYLKLEKEKNYNFNTNVGSNVAYYCLYGEDKSIISCTRLNNNNDNINLSYNGYIRYSIIKQATKYVRFTGEYCYNLLEKQNQTSENIESALNDSSVDNPQSGLDGLNANIGTNSVISDLLLLPVTLYQSVLNNINGTCSAFTLGTMYGHQLRMPCLNISGVIGNAIYGVIDVLISGFFILSIRKKFVDIFNHFTSLKVGGNELE